jgi:acyl-CoA hydrolase
MEKGRVTLRFLAEPTDVNFGGKVHGGQVMRWIDQAGYSCALGWSSTYSVTAYVSGIQFKRPLHIGDMVEVAARIIHTGNTSMHFAVDVYGEPLKGGDKEHTCHCVIVFVAIDEAGNTVSVPRFEPKTDEDRGLQAYAKDLMSMREEIASKMESRAKI